MVTLFISDEAVDYLLDEFRDNGFPEPLDAEWTQDILLVFVDESLNVRCRKNCADEEYQNTSRVFPPTFTYCRNEKVTLEEQKLASCSCNTESFINGKTVISGISSDENLNWLCLSILLRRLVIPYVREHITDRDYDPRDDKSGIYFFCLEGKLIDKSVKGRERPDLAYVHIDPETGELVEEPERFYEEEIIEPEKFDAVMRRLENRPRFVVNPEGNGDKLELPPDFLDAYQSSRLVIDGMHRKHALSDRIAPVEFRRKDALWQHDLNPSAERIFITVDTLMKLPEPDVQMKMISDVLLPEAVIEVVDADFTCVVEIGGRNKENTKLSLYTRFGLPMMSPVRAEAGNIRDKAKSFLGDGLLASDGEGGLGDIAFSLLFGYKRILAVLIASEWFQKHGKSTDAQTGILVDADDGDIVIRMVSGKQRPDMICGGDEWQLGFWRPYERDDVYESPSVDEHISIETVEAFCRGPAETLKNQLTENNAVIMLEAETAKSNPQAMKMLAEKYAKGEDVPKDLRRALSLYEKAFVLLPDDDDLEFEIFMLKMEIDDQ